MNRRDTLRNLMLASGSLIALPAWAREWSLHEITTHPTSFSVPEQDILASVADTIIPAGDAIGAISVGVPQFLQKLIDKCYEKEIQENVKMQLAALEASAQQAHSTSFESCDQAQREELLLRLSHSENKNERDFFNLVKSETIRGFNTSREVMVNYHHFKLVPGHYYGCVDVKSL